MASSERGASGGGFADLLQVADAAAPLSGGETASGEVKTAIRRLAKAGGQADAKNSTEARAAAAPIPAMPVSTTDNVAQPSAVVPSGIAPAVADAKPANDNASTVVPLAERDDASDAPPEQKAAEASDVAPVVGQSLPTPDPSPPLSGADATGKPAGAPLQVVAAAVAGAPAEANASPSDEASSDVRSLVSEAGPARLTRADTVAPKHGSKPAPPQAAVQDDAGAGPSPKADTSASDNPAPPAEAPQHPTHAKPDAVVPRDGGRDAQVPAGQPAADPSQSAATMFAGAPNGVVQGSEPARAAAAADAPGVAVAGLAVEIAARAAEGKRRFEIRLDPPELGRIDVRLDFGRDGQVTSRLVVERAETLDLLRRDAHTLEQTLHSAGLRTDGGALQFSLRDQSGQQGAQYESTMPRLLIVPDEDVAVQEAVRRAYGVLRGLGRGVDIQV